MLSINFPSGLLSIGSVAEITLTPFLFSLDLYIQKGYRTDKGSYNRKVILKNTNVEIEKINNELSILNIEKRSIKKEIIETELGCPLSETFGIESDKIQNIEDFILALNKENILHTIKNRNDGKRVIFFANRDKEKVSDIFYTSNQNKSVKKHRSR